MGDGHGAGNGARLRLARQARGFSQQQLAAMAGVSRQAVSAVESGQSDPSLRAALGLARALGMTVEEVFGSSSPPPQVVARPVAPLGGEGARVTLAPMGEGLVALPLSGATVSRAGFLPAGGLAAGAGSADSEPGAGEQVRPIGPPLRPELADGVCGVGDLAERGLRLVNREPGAEARLVLDRELSRLGIEASALPGYGTQASGHLHVAAAIAAGLADAGVASEPAALAYGLAFVPLTAERFDLVIPASQAGSARCRAC